MYAPLQAFAAKPLSQADIVRHTDLTNRTAFGLVQACLEAEVPPGLVANVFLYYWLRGVTGTAQTRQCEKLRARVFHCRHKVSGRRHVVSGDIRNNVEYILPGLRRKEGRGKHTENISVSI